MSCRFCGAEARTDWGYQCGSGPNLGQRSQSCWQREVGSLRIRVDYLHDLLAEWRDYADGLEESGDAMKEGATTPEQMAWDRQLKRRPKA